MTPEGLESAAPAEAADLLSLHRLLTSEELAEYLQVPMHTLDAWASRGGGPPFRRVSKYRRYKPADVREWLDGQRRDPGHAQEPAA